MKLRPILRSDTHAAATLLAEGFPAHSKEVWLESIRRLFAHVEGQGENAIGHIASADGRDVGIGLAIPGTRSAYEPAPRKVVNVAAFYLRQGHEWMTSLFLRRVMKDKSLEYVDITASMAMREVNRKLGFADQSAGGVVVPTAAACFLPARGARIVAFSEAHRKVLSAEHCALLAQHAEMKAMALVAEIDGAAHPLILVTSRRKRVRGARVILARDRKLIGDVVGPLSRYLLRRGALFLEFDGDDTCGIPTAIFVNQIAPVQTTRPTAGKAIDHTFSELLFIPPPKSRAVARLATGRRSTALPLPLSLADVSIAVPACACMLGCIAESPFI